MENRLSSNDASFDAPVASDNDDEMMSPSQYIEDKTYDPEIIVAKAEADDLNHNELSDALKMLDDRSKDILQRRYLADRKQLFMILLMNMVFLLRELDRLRMEL